MLMEYKSFKKWRAEEVEQAFGIVEVEELTELEQWVAAKPALTPRQVEELHATHAKARRFVPNWNEEELKLFLIGRLLNAVDFNEFEYRAFAEQQLELTAGNIGARGLVDFLVANGKQTPQAPYFLLQEYKPVNKTIYDPKGQLIVAMVAAQKRNEAAGLDQPVYGAYVIGRLWFFVVLTGSRYAVSLAYDCTREDQIAIVLNALQQVKIYIEELLQTPA